MMEIEVPGFSKLSIENLVFDYNGTIAKDGTPVKGVKDKFTELSKNLKIYIITADTHGTAAEILKDYSCELAVINGEDQTRQKKNFIEKLGSRNTAAFGNGFNDSLMLKTAQLGIAVLMEEGAHTSTILNSDMVVKSVLDGIDLFLKPKRLTAGLRNS